jgi:hypothetical protein
MARAGKELFGSQTISFYQFLPSIKKRERGGTNASPSRACVWSAILDLSGCGQPFNALGALPFFTPEALPTARINGMKVHSKRSQVHSSRSKVHAKRMKVHERGRWAEEAERVRTSTRGCRQSLWSFTSGGRAWPGR